MAVNHTRTIVDVARAHAETTPDRPAYLFLPDGREEGRRFDFAAIDLRARAIAAVLTDRGTAGRRVLVAYPSGAAYVQSVLGCLYAGAIVVPADAPDRPASARRLAAVTEAAAPALILAARTAPDSGGDEPGGHRLDVADVPDDAAAHWRPPTLHDTDPAVLQYTSGSTRAPRGVVVSHANIMANEDAIRLACGHDRESTFVGWLPLYHDMGLIANVLQPLFLGARSVLMPPAAFLGDPSRWLRAIDRYRAHTSGGPNFAYELCAAKITERQRSGLDLSGWRVAFNGAEPVRAATLRKFAEKFAPNGFRDAAFLPCYGLAEATLMVAAAPRDAPPTVLRADAAALRAGTVEPAVHTDAADTELVSSGRVVPGTEIRIVDPDTLSPCPDGAVGEVWVRGPGVAGAYADDPEQTRSVLAARIGPDGPYLRTGDLGCLRAGELYVTGRCRDLLVVHGANHYPHDLEWTAEQANSALRPSCGAVFALSDTWEGPARGIALCYELRAEVAEPARVADAVRRAITQRHGVVVDEIAFVARGSIPKTTSGKVMRHACRAAYAAGTLPVIARFVFDSAAAAPNLPAAAELAGLPDAERVVVLAAALRDTLAHRAGVLGPVSLDDPPVSLGVTSIALVELGHRVDAEYGVTIDQATLLSNISIRELATRILTTTAEPVARVEHDARWRPLSGAQGALWFEQQAVPGSAAYHLARALSFDAPLDPAALRAAVYALIDRHPRLRTRFAVRDGIPMSKPDGPRPEPVVEQAANDDPEAFARRLADHADEPFDLAAGPLLRIVLLRRGARGDVLMLVAHHLIVDFWSLVVLIRELGRGYRGEPLSGRAGAGESDVEPGDSEMAFWRDHFADAPTMLDLPPARRRPLRRTAEGATHIFRLPARSTAALRASATAQRSTMFTAVFAAWRLLLHRYCAQPDLTVATVTAGRAAAEDADAIGYLARVLPIRSRLRPGESARELMRRARREVLDALAHTGVPMDRLVAELDPVRDPARPTLVQAMFVMQQEHGSPEDGLRALALGVPGPLSFAGRTAAVIPVPRRWSQLDLTLSVAEIDGELVGVWEYRTDLFTPATMDALSAWLLRVLEVIGRDPGRSVDEIDPPGHAARRTLSGPRRSRPAHAGLHDLVGAIARSRPDAIAVVAETADGERVISYGTLWRRATALAAALRDRGMRPGEPVALLLERGADLPIGYLAVLAGGGAVLPLDPADPDRRLAATLADSGARLILTHPTLLRRASGFGIRAMTTAEATPGRELVAAVHPEQTAYLLYTSGSTGAPKGVLVPHRGIVNRIQWMRERFGDEAAAAVLHKTPVTFDVSVWELLWPLVSGGQVVIARPGGHRDPVHLHRLITRHRISTAHFVPSMLAPYLAERARDGSARYPLRVLCSGEALAPDLVRRFHATGGAALHNLYGPTEASIDVTEWECVPGEYDAVPIGRPIANTTCAVVDASGRAVPDLFVGELYLGGVGLARGYANRPAATAASFVPDPALPGARRYRTGDLARRDADGRLEYLGRRDDQVKIGGVRVEPGEVAAMLRGRADIRDAAVVARADRLIGYAVVEPSETVVTGEHLRYWLADRLPGALVPAAVVLLDALPLRSSGKLDLGALPEPSARRAVAETPSTATESRLAAIWSEQLGAAAIDLGTDFFALGGDSIRAIRVVAAARAAGFAVTVAELLEHRTVRAVARRLDDPDRRESDETGVATAPFELCPEAARRPGAQDAYPISMAQRALLFHHDTDPAYEVYVTSIAVHRPLDRARLTAATGRVMLRHRYLRSSFDLVSYAEPVQVVATEVVTPLSFVDLTAAAEAETEFARWLEAERGRGFDLERGPLARFTVHLLGAEFRLTIASFGLDGWCVATVLTELLRDYAGARIAAPDVDYRDFVALERAALASPEHRRFWAGQLADAERCALPRLPGYPRPRRALERQARRVVAIDGAVRDALDELAATLGVGRKHVLLGVHLEVLRALTGSAEVLTGVECHGRPERADGDRVVGVFNNIVPLRVAVDAVDSRAELVTSAHAAEAALWPFRRYPLAQLQREHGAARLFDTLFAYTHFHVYERLDGVSVSDLRAPDQTYVPLTAHFNTDAWSGELRLLLDVDPAEFGAEQVEFIAACYEGALVAMARSSSDRPGDVVDSARASAPAAASGPAHVAALIGAAVRRAPDHIAVVEAGAHLSYAGLWARSARPAAALRSAGIGRDSVVAIPGTRRVKTVIALLGVLRSGAAYLPLDPRQPPHRLRELCRAASASVLIPSGAAPEWARDLPIVRSDDSVRPGVPIPRGRDHGLELACVMPTSGSTGTPKLVGVPHRGLANYLRWAVEHYRIDTDTVAPVTSPLAFDLTVTALLAPLTAGGTVHLYPDDDPGTLGRALATGRCTLVKLTPTHLSAVVEQLGADARTGLRTVVVGGEQLHLAHIRGVRTIAPDATVFNEYGPTETIVGCTVHGIAPGAPEPAEGPVPIGRPIAGADVRVVDHRHEAAPGVAGELYIGGIGTTRGYLGAPAATAAAFGPDPHATGARRYRTGDLGLRLPDGDLRYLGRADRQVKIRGHRVELGEIEAALMAHPEVRQAVVLTSQGPGGRLRTTAYWVGDADGTELGAWLRGRLPHFAVPDQSVRVSRLPVTANGKVDHRALPESARSGRAAALAERIATLSAAEVERLLSDARATARTTGTGEA
ncbi:amino acid adenylation domain-containing protein [Nocardia sp. NPDC047038]|uniref:amino acid adenylation domain-containing protein n=1 Tax=Nocardia sp. NPDC047038 TaxID=3154338 RepID=UPI0033C87C15